MDHATRTRLEQLAVDNGFSKPAGGREGWLLFEAHAVPCVVSLNVDGDGRHLVATSHVGVARELRDHCSEAHSAPEGFWGFVAEDAADAFRLLGRIWTLANSLPDHPLAEFERLKGERFDATEVERVRTERIGQGVFRNALIGFWEGACAVTGVRNNALLRAGHIIPWAQCPCDEERMNVFNGLLLVATLDAAFDSGLVSFDDDGRIEISSSLAETDRIAGGIKSAMRLRIINNEIRSRLTWHRENIFLHS